MPLVKAGSATGSAKAGPQDGAPAEGVPAHVANLSAPTEDLRWQAARALGNHGDAAPALAAALARETSPRVREAIVTALLRIGGEASVRAMLPCLRAEDAGLRSAVIDALQTLPAEVLPFMPALLADSDSDVRILATELARNLPAGEATRLLATVLERDQHPNVCAAAIEVLTEVGTRAALPALKICAERFAATPFLPLAVSIAVDRISGSAE